ncbi:MAG: AtpZ/AtpI family protein [Crocinitomicaceae bacterium]|nr:AtpZ/AtpI family protein [Flavobacteriales bacterium]NQZ34746.1 AtpZ/AtpI family protein [Crocinitomicaceae bacterium]PHR35634.1 MAG: F0F1-ATPase subunit [Fluviicola sp.]
MSDEQKNKPSSFSRVARLSGIGMQMAGTIFVFAMIGKWLDGKYPSDKKWFTIGLVLLATVLSMYNILRQVNAMNKDEDDRKKK